MRSNQTLPRYTSSIIHHHYYLSLINNQSMIVNFDHYSSVTACCYTKQQDFFTRTICHAHTHVIE